MITNASAQEIHDAIAPHGGVLISRLAAANDLPVLEEHARTLPRLTISSRAVAELELIAVGAFSPLEGFMTRVDYEAVLKNMHLSNGVVWPLPVTLAVAKEDVAVLGLRENHEAALADASGRTVAVLAIEEIYPYDKEREAQLAYGTTDAAHPGVSWVYSQGDILLGGKVIVLLTRTVRAKLRVPVCAHFGGAEFSAECSCQ